MNAKRTTVRSRAGMRRGRGAFTLIEVLVVVTILGILAVLIVPRFLSRIGTAKEAVAKQNVAILEHQVVVFQMDTGRLPTPQEGLQALLRPPPDVASKWKEPYAKEKDLIDPWGRQYVYRYPGRLNSDFDIYSLGADGSEGGEGENADIGNW